MTSYAFAFVTISALGRSLSSLIVEKRLLDFGPSFPQHRYSPQYPHRLQALRTRSDQIFSADCFQNDPPGRPNLSASRILARVSKLDVPGATMPLGSGTGF